MTKYEVGFNIPATKGMSVNDIQTPALIVDFSLFQENIKKMKDFCKNNKILLRPHAKMHKSVDVANYQLKYGGAHGICCQKISEAEVFAKAGIKDILITNQICDPIKIERLIKLAKSGCKISCCVDDFQNVIDIEKCAEKNNVYINIYVEFECGSRRCGITSKEQIKKIINLIKDCKHLIFKGLQAYNGSNQHIVDNNKRKKAVLDTNLLIRDLISELGCSDILVTGGGTGCFEDEIESNIYNEIQVGSYAFMDAHYSKIKKRENKNIFFKNSLYLLTSVISNNLENQAVVDAGLKSQSVDSGLPSVLNDQDLRYIKCSDEHGIVEDKKNKLRINDRIFLIPGHCDPTCNLHDWYVLIKDDIVYDLWPVSARGFSF